MLLSYRLIDGFIIERLEGDRRNVVELDPDQLSVV